MTTITQTITALPAVPDPATDSAAAFSTKAAAFVLAQKAMAVELETFRTQANTVAGEMSSNTFQIAAAGGTADAITATFSTPLTLTDKVRCAIVLTAANATTTPSFAPDGLTAHTIVKLGGQALRAGDLPGALAVALLEYNLANTRWEVLNPAYGAFNPAAAGALAGVTTLAAATTIGVGGATPAASGAGITFPATQSASTDANTLDDYEEGTWTPTIDSDGGTASGQSYSVQTGLYTKIGRRVFTNCNLTLSDKGTIAAGGVQVKGLPFTQVLANREVGGTVFFSGLATNWISLAPRVGGNDATIYISGMAAAGANMGNLQNTDIGNTSQFAFTYDYGI